MTSSDVVIHILKELEFVDADDSNGLWKMYPKKYPAFGRISRWNGNIEITIMPNNDVCVVVQTKGSEVHISKPTSVFSSFYGPFEVINLACPDSVEQLKSIFSKFKNYQK